jgi:protein-S-isoprenylcysteine O-methyltransferase Ste14
MTNPELIFRVVQGLIVLAFVLHRGYYTRKFPPPEAETVEKLDSGLAGKIANLLALPALAALALYVFLPEYVFWASLPFPFWLRWTGVLIAVGGFALLQSAHAALGKNWSDQPRILESQSFVRGGPYERIRHPMYTAFLLILGSSLLTSANWLVGGLWIAITWIDIRARIRFEEDRLGAKFGEPYEAYKKRTGALLPRL